VRTRLRETAATVGSSRYRAWRRLLAGLTLDPDALPDPLAGPGPRDFVVCGAPRTGTALLTAMLFQPPDIVTVMEPWDALRLPPAELFRSLRDEIDSTGVLTRGRLDVAALRAEGAVRWCHDGELPEPVSTSPGYLLGVKMPALWRYLDRLPNTKFLVCLRDPVEVVHSFCATGGRLAQGLDYDVPFNRAMNEDLLAATARWADERQAIGLPAPRVGAAIATGPVMFGTIGDHSRLEYTVIGDPVNLAAKLEKHTKAEQVQALCPRAAYHQALAQGYRPTATAEERSQCRVAGIDAPLDLAVLA